MEKLIDMKSRIYAICRDYLQGSWKKISQHDMILKHVSGGLSNHLYFCALPSDVKPLGHEPNEVLVRFYGQVHGEGVLESLLGESVIFALLSERRLGPRLYGIFPGGRIEQYIPARCLTTVELSDPIISNQIAIKMATLHSLHVPISKEPTWIWNCMDRWIRSSEEFLLRPPPEDEPVTSNPVLESLKSFKYSEELAFVRRLVNRVRSPVVFSHNDMQEGNILLKHTQGDIAERITLIDFEYSSYNHRGFDLANHFCEWMYCYKVDEEPYFSVNKKAFPSMKEQLRFIRAYTSSLSHCASRKIPIEKNSNGDRITAESEDLGRKDAETALEDKLLREIRVFEVVSHLMWATWSIVQAYVSKIPFGYLKYASVRMEHYQECKTALRKEDLGKRDSSD